MSPIAATKPLPAGLWGLARIDGGPVAVGDARILGLECHDAAWIAEGRDGQDPDSVSELDDAGGHTILTGWIADRVGLAARLGLDRNAVPVQLARTALALYDRDTPAEMLGEWSLFHRSPDGEIILMLAATRRDRLFFAQQGSRLAFAPEPFVLGQLGWVGRDFDDEALLLNLAEYSLWSLLGWRTMFAAIEQLPPGASLRIAPNRPDYRYVCDALPPQPRFAGDAHEALAEGERLLRASIGDRITPNAAILLSGGLDSALLTALTAEEIGGRSLMAICSAAPPELAVADELPFARMVAERYGITLLSATPPNAPDPYRPPPHILRGANGPLISNRHCLTACFQTIASEAGATMLVNGTYGEMGISARRSEPAGLRYRLGALRRRLRGMLVPAQRDRFHVQLASHRLVTFAAKPAGEIDAGSSLSGYFSGTGKALEHPNAFYAGALRMDFPYRDVRLLRHFASLPRGINQALGLDRGPARLIGRGRLPDEILARQHGLPADPGHYARLQAFAEPARSRIAAFRAAEVDDWLDLAWLDEALARVAATSVRSVSDANRVQLTALAAEFLTLQRTGDCD